MPAPLLGVIRMPFVASAATCWTSSQPATLPSVRLSRGGQFALNEGLLECPFVDHHAAQCAAAAYKQR